MTKGNDPRVESNEHFFCDVADEAEQAIVQELAQAEGVHEFSTRWGVAMAGDEATVRRLLHTAGRVATAYKSRRLTALVEVIEEIGEISASNYLRRLAESAQLSDEDEDIEELPLRKLGAAQEL